MYVSFNITNSERSFIQTNSWQVNTTLDTLLKNDWLQGMDKYLRLQKTVPVMLMVHFDSYFKCSSISLTLFHMGRGADYTRLQIVFFITFVRDAAEPQKVVTFFKNLMDNKILNNKFSAIVT